MTTNNRETIIRATGIIEGVACTLDNANTRDILFDVAEMLDGVLSEEGNA